MSVARKPRAIRGWQLKRLLLRPPRVWQRELAAELGLTDGQVSELLSWRRLLTADEARLIRAAIERVREGRHTDGSAE